MEERFETFTVLITRISRSIKRIKADEMADFELKGPHVSCLYYLSQRDGMTAAELCERCDEDKAAISRSLDDLEKNGYITCASGAGKRYKSPLRLTERGKAVGRAIGEKITRIVEAASEGLSEAERQTMYRALALVSENLERIYTHKKTAGDRAARDETITEEKHECSDHCGFDGRHARAHEGPFSHRAAHGAFWRGGVHRRRDHRQAPLL